MVRVWMADITPLLIEETYQAYYRELPEWRKEKADRHHHLIDRAQSVGAWSLWMRVKERYGLLDEVVYNLSHSGNYVLCAFSDTQGAKVGCDLEVVKDLREAVARRFFCQAEYEHLMQIEEPERTRRFFRYWVLKESFLKATRRGMALDTRSFEIGWDENDSPYLKDQPVEFPERYYYQEYHRANVDAGIAVCTTDPEIDKQLYLLEV